MPYRRKRLTDSIFSNESLRDAVSRETLDLYHSKNAFAGIIGGFRSVIHAEYGTDVSLIQNHILLLATIPVAVDHATRTHRNSSGKDLL